MAPGRADNTNVGRGASERPSHLAPIDLVGADLPVGDDDVEFYRQVVETAPDGIVVVDAGGTIRLVNNQAERLFGWDRGQLIGQSLEVLVPERIVSRHPTHRASFLNAPRTRPMGAGLELTARRADGSEVPVDISLSPLNTRYGTWVSAAVRDATLRKRSESELRDAYLRLSVSLAEMERRGRELALVGEMGDMLQSCLDVEEAHAVAAAFMSDLFPDTIGAIYRPMSSRSVLRSGASWGGGDLTLTLNGNDCWALRRGRPHRTSGATTALRCRHGVQTRSRWSVCVPLLAHGEMLGMLHLQSGDEAEAGADSSEAVLHLAISVAEHLSLALANLALRESLQTQSERDALTGLYNRRRFELAIEAGTEEAAEEQYPVSLLIVDVDGFKEVNDREGHAEGDEVLRSLSHILLREIRSGDSAFRLGGDEFAILLPHCPAHAAAARAEQIRRAAEGDLPTTVSIGFATLEPGERAKEDLLQLADLSLYEAKARGRNRVADATHLPPA